jgi:hypothetical protein
MDDDVLCFYSCRLPRLQRAGNLRKV